MRERNSRNLVRKYLDFATWHYCRNILCFPIKQADGRTIGVAELCNKAGPGGEGHFTFFDQVHVTHDKVLGTMENFKQSLPY